MATHAAFDCGAEILPEMEAVGDLDRVRSTSAGPIGVRAAPVTANDLGAGMGARPAGQGRCVAAGQQIERPAGLAVDEHGALVLSASGG